MTIQMPFEPKGVIPACLLPFKSDMEIDENAFRSHLCDLAAVDGISAITINAHSMEVHALSIKEQAKTLEISLVSLVIIISFGLNFYFGHQGLMPLDDLQNFNSGFRVLNGDFPFKDYYSITGPILDIWPLGPIK